LEYYFPGILVYELIILQPFVNRLLCLVHFSVVDGWPLNNICLGEHFTDSRDSPAEAIAAMSGEKDDGLAAEIISFEEGMPAVCSSWLCSYLSKRWRYIYVPMAAKMMTASNTPKTIFFFIFNDLRVTMVTCRIAV